MWERCLVDCCVFFRYMYGKAVELTVVYFSGTRMGKVSWERSS